MATHNQHKAKEISALLENCPWRLIDSSWSADETETTLAANALIKARSAGAFVGHDEIVAGEDTGLFVDALGGDPGVYSARYAGDSCSYDDNVQKLLSAMGSLAGEKRRAHFMTCFVVIFPDGAALVSSGRLDGFIINECRGIGGFGYDPVFLVPQFGLTLAQLTLEQKNSLSHRARAVRQALPYLKKPFFAPMNKEAIA